MPRARAQDAIPQRNGLSRVDRERIILSAHRMAIAMQHHAPLLPAAAILTPRIATSYKDTMLSQEGELSDKSSVPRRGGDLERKQSDLTGQ